MRRILFCSWAFRFGKYCTLKTGSLTECNSSASIARAVSQANAIRYSCIGELNSIGLQTNRYRQQSLTLGTATPRVDGKMLGGRRSTNAQPRHYRSLFSVGFSFFPTTNHITIDHLLMAFDPCVYFQSNWLNVDVKWLYLYWASAGFRIHKSKISSDGLLPDGGIGSFYYLKMFNIFDHRFQCNAHQLRQTAGRVVHIVTVPRDTPNWICTTIRI